MTVEIVGTGAGIQQFDFSVDLLQVLLWQQQPAVNIQAIIAAKQAWYDENQTKFWTDWYSDVFNLITANEFGLSVWSIILNQPLVIQGPPDPPDVPIFGFDSEPPHVNFNRGFFSNYGQSIGFTIEEKRILLRLKYFKCISRGSVPQTNRMLASVFKDLGVVYVLDGLDMSIRVVFKFNVNSKFLYAIKVFDLIPRCTGVKISYIITTESIFGFDAYHKNFDNGYFAEGLG